MSQPVSRRRLADILGVTESAIRSAIKGNRISVLPSGMIDPDRARREWMANTDPARNKVRTSRKVRTQSAQSGAHPAPDVHTEAEAREAVSLIVRILSEEGMRDDGKGVDFGKVRTAELILKARKREHDLRKEQRQVYDAAGCERIFFEEGKNNRDAWRAWPARVAIEMADELGVDSTTGKVDYRVLVSVLTSYVHRHLVEMGEPEEPTWPSAR